VVDIDKILEKELFEQQELNKKIKDFVEEKKVKTVKSIFKEKIYLIVFVFSSLIIILATSYYLVFYEQLIYFSNSKKSFKDEKETTFFTNNTKNFTQEFYENNEQNKSVTVNLKEKINEKREIINKNCGNLSGEDYINCLVNLSYNYKDPSFCSFLSKRDRIFCLEKYKELTSPIIGNEEPFYEELINSFLEGKISREELEQYYPLEELAEMSRDPRFCKFLDNPEKFDFCIEK